MTPAKHPSVELAGLAQPVSLLVFTIVSVVFWDSIPLVPLKLLVVTFHELGHAAVALATGGRVVEIVVNWEESGHTLSEGGWPLLILNGGYLGSLMTGVFLLSLTRKEGRGRLLLGALGLGLWMVAALWIPILSFGFGYALVFGGLLLWLSRRAPVWFSEFGSRSIGIFSVLYALFDIRSDVFGSVVGASDAVMLAQRTGIPAVLWGGGWLLAGLSLLWLARRRV